MYYFVCDFSAGHKLLREIVNKNKNRKKKKLQDQKYHFFIATRIYM